MLIHHPQLQHQNGVLKSRDIFQASRNRWFIAYRAPNVHQQTGRRLVDRFWEHRRDVINGRNDLPVPAHFNQTNRTLEDMKVAVLKAGLANQDYRKKQEMRLIFKYTTMGNSGLNQDFSFTWIMHSLFGYSRARARFISCGPHTSMQSGAWANFNELFNGI